MSPWPSFLNAKKLSVNSSIRNDQRSNKIQLRLIYIVILQNIYCIEMKASGFDPVVVILTRLRKEDIRILNHFS